MSSYCWCVEKANQKRISEGIVGGNKDLIDMHSVDKRDLPFFIVVLTHY